LATFRMVKSALPLAVAGDSVTAMDRKNSMYFISEC
jgi:hypothetical protein